VMCCLRLCFHGQLGQQQQAGQVVNELRFECGQCSSILGQAVSACGRFLPQLPDTGGQKWHDPEHAEL
jgi:hypothetical protein